jgi:hypothetical protein
VTQRGCRSLYGTGLDPSGRMHLGSLEKPGCLLTGRHLQTLWRAALALAGSMIRPRTDLPNRNGWRPSDQTVGSNISATLCTASFPAYRGVFPKIFCCNTLDFLALAEDLQV